VIEAAISTCPSVFLLVRFYIPNIQKALLFNLPSSLDCRGAIVAVKLTLFFRFEGHYYSFIR
jgi:hypothetical protein